MPPRRSARRFVALGNIVREQAMIMGYADTFAVLGVLLLLAAGLLLFTRRGQASAPVSH
jgi:MFS transporter, DHA2 family, multidrug resistance protein